MRPTYKVKFVFKMFKVGTVQMVKKVQIQICRSNQGLRRVPHLLGGAGRDWPGV